MMFRLFNLYILSFLLLLEPSLAVGAAIARTQLIKDGETILSAGEIFELGFFSSSHNSMSRYLGIWFHKIPVQTVVWVANGDNPVANSQGRLIIRNDGNLAVLEESGTTRWSTDASIASKSKTSTMLLDNGNFVLMEGGPGGFLWQSFNHPSNTLLPGMKIGLNLKTGDMRTLRSWKKENDPAPCNFSFGVDRNDPGQIFIWKGSFPYWRSGRWNGQTFNKMPEAKEDFAFHFISLRGREGDEDAYYVFNTMYNNTRLVLDPSGHVRYEVWFDASKSWGLTWIQPRDICNVYAACGPFSVCDSHDTPACRCMEGFMPASPSSWNLENWVHGCVRKAQLQCGKGDGFLSMGLMGTPDGESVAIAANEEECRAKCVGNCSCTAYAYADVSKNAAAAACLVWHGRLMDAGELTTQDKDEGARHVYIRVAASELISDKKKELLVIIAIGSAIGFLLIGTVIYSFMSRKKRRGVREESLQMPIFNLGARVPTAYNFLEQHFGEDVKERHVPAFRFESIATATDNFSDSNKLGQGGFGVVYKGTLQGEEIAVKRLFNNSRQGIEEFSNEAILMAKLQHQNLVRLLGYCIEEDEMLLVYEYMPNKSLNIFLFDESGSMLLDWEKRFNIILGIARGLLYLHQDSRLMIIHRDLKASNILLDKDMEPKISDFGMARIFQGDQTHASTKRIFGTYGYMSPEYAMSGHFSVKSDVFSFGVLLLEIITGKKNSYYDDYEDSLSFLDQAWKLWNDGKGMDLVDTSLVNSCCAQGVLKCLQVGLLCVQADPRNRPSMATVVMFLSNTTELPTPRQPPFYLATRSGKYSSNDPRTCSVNEMTITLLEGR